MTGDPQEMHRKKRAVKKNISQHEMSLRQSFVHHSPEYLRKPVINRGEQRKDNTRHHVMKMRHDIVSVMDKNIDGSRSHEDTAQASDDEVRDETQCEEHRRGKTNRPAPQGAEPIEGLDRRWHSDHHGGHHKRGAEKRIHAADEHMMAPDDPG